MRFLSYFLDLALDETSGCNHLTWWSTSATLTFDDDAIFNQLATPYATWFLA
jgi:hypothetical protein